MGVGLRLNADIVRPFRASDLVKKVPFRGFRGKRIRQKISVKINFHVITVDNELTTRPG